MGERFKNLIDGRWVDSANGTTFDDVNPANKTDVVGSFPRSDHRDIDRAVEAARSRVTDWSRLSSFQRGEVLYRAARILEERAEQLAAVIVRETGKVLAESDAELRDALAMLRAIAGEASRLGGATVPSERPEAFAMAAPVPLGVTAVITHWTFPLAGCIWTTVSALAVGNTVVLKPAEDAPLAATRFTEILLEAGLPTGTISLVHGYGEEAGAPLVRHPDVVLVSFAGSPEVGREVAIACAAEQRRFLLDLGERSVVIVLDDADLDLAIDGAVGGGLAVAGQRWRGAVPLFVHRKAAKEIGERLVARAQALRLGDGLLATTDLGPIINETQVKRVHSHTRLGLRDGAKLLCGGEVVKDGDCKRGFFYAPTVFGDVAFKMRLTQEEILGPMLGVVPVASVDEAVEHINAVRRDLTTSVYSRDVARALRVVDAIRTGRVYVNPTPPRPGGRLALTSFNRVSRIRREAILSSLDRFGTWKEATVEFGGKHQ
jgi:acyl-CoA reductase-like NAD-dependent aldehyde dehydrogenase